MVKLALELDTIDSDIQNYFFRENRTIEECLAFCSEHKASDLYIEVYKKPYISRYGIIKELPCNPISRAEWSRFTEKYITNEKNILYAKTDMLDTSVAIRIPENSIDFGKYPDNMYRYRASFGFSGGNRINIATFRMIRPEKITFNDINFPNQCEDVLRKALNKRSSMTLVVGPTGSGKSTTMAACINTFTQKNDVLDNKVIITLEDPIENTFDSTTSVKIVQKELQEDFISFPLGVKQALREHPNMIIVGEMRDKEVITTAIEAARTGHSVLSTIHSADVGGTVARMLFYLDNDPNLTLDLIVNLNLIMAQKLIPNDTGYLVDTQYLYMTDDIKKELLHIASDGKNVALQVTELVTDTLLLEQGLSKDWQYKDFTF